MAFKPQVINTKPIKGPTISTKGLTLPHATLKIGFGVKPQHVAKINWGKKSKSTQKSTGQL